MITEADRLLSATDVNVEAFALCEIAPDSCLVTPPILESEVHFVVDGTLHFSVPGETPLTLKRGAVLITPAGLPQRLAATPTPDYEVAANAVCEPQSTGMLLFDATEVGTGDLRVLCGRIRAEIAGSIGILDGLTRPIYAELGDIPFVRGAFEAMVSEVSAGAIGCRTVISSLMRACLVVLLRHHVAASDTAATLFSKPRLARAVAEVVANLAAPHSVASLACTAGMSRSGFARAFSEALGMSPMECVTRIRMRRARELLSSSDLPIAAIAAAIGISRSHFSRLFREAYGVHPTNFRGHDRSEETSLA